MKYDNTKGMSSEQKSRYLKNIQHLSKGRTDGLSLADHHDRDYYRRVNARTTTNQNDKYSKYRDDVLGSDYVKRHGKYKTQGDLSFGGKSG